MSIKAPAHAVASPRSMRWHDCDNWRWDVHAPLLRLLLISAQCAHVRLRI